jgi:ribosomal protein L11 methyltransferase
MYSLLIEIGPGADRDIAVADLWEAGATGITEESDSLRAFFEFQPDDVAARFAHLHPTLLQEEESLDWVRFAQDQWSPFSVGDRFYLVPEWLDDPAPEGRLRLTMHPGMACGTGTHAATRLCLMAMEQYIRPGCAVLDVGTGAGILADAAGLLGASRVVGCDIEHDSTLVARRNLQTSISLFTGSVRSVRDQAFDWAVCNLNAATIKTMAGELHRAARNMILSGFREEEVSAVKHMFHRNVKSESELEGYACLIY